MLSIIVFLFFMWIFFRITIAMFRIAGRLLGWILGGFVWLILAAVAVTVFGLALVAVPVVLIVGATALAIGTAR